MLFQHYSTTKEETHQEEDSVMQPWTGLYFERVSFIGDVKASARSVLTIWNNETLPGLYPFKWEMSSGPPNLTLLHPVHLKLYNMCVNIMVMGEESEKKQQHCKRFLLFMPCQTGLSAGSSSIDIQIWFLPGRAVKMGLKEERSRRRTFFTNKYSTLKYSDNACMKHCSNDGPTEI